MSDERVLCTFLGGIKRVQIHAINKLYRYDEATGKFVPDTSQMGDPEVAANIGDLIGYLNKAEAEQYGGVPTLPVRILPQYVGGPHDIDFTVGVGEIVAIPIQLPPGPYATSDILSASSAELSAPALRTATISPTPGDLQMPPISQGLQASVNVAVTDAGTIKPGMLVYYNVRMQEGHPATLSRFSADLPK